MSYIVSASYAVIPVIGIGTLIHSIDSVRLAEAVNRVAEEEHVPRVNVLLEVAVSGDATKHGFEPDELPAALDAICRLKHVVVKGLMCMAGLDADEREIRRQFSSVRQLADTLRLPELSMGMSDDFDIAVEEGATLVRVGSRLYPGAG